MMNFLEVINMVNISIVGYGKMGQMIETIAKRRGVNIISIIDPNEDGATHKTISVESLNGVDVVIDFTHPEIIMDNINLYSKFKVNAVIGTTGWYDEMDKVKELVKASGIALMWSGNFSIGVNMFFKIVDSASKLVNKITDYDLMGVEYHHNKKADSPSGTMKMIGDIIIDNVDRKKEPVYEMLDREIKSDELHLASVRGGNIPGIHEVRIDSVADTITLSHSARTREGFALGSVLAAEFMLGKKGFFGIEALMDGIIGGNNEK